MTLSPEYQEATFIHRCKLLSVWASHAPRHTRYTSLMSFELILQMSINCSPYEDVTCWAWPSWCVFTCSNVRTQRHKYINNYVLKIWGMKTAKKPTIRTNGTEGVIRVNSKICMMKILDLLARFPGVNQSNNIISSNCQYFRVFCGVKPNTCYSITM